MGCENLTKKRIQKTWTDEEEKLLIKNYGELTQAELAKLLGRSIGAIRSKIANMGLVKGKVNKGNFRTKDCPRCGTKNRIRNLDCYECKLKFHTLANCQGCGELSGKRCLAFMDRRDPILKPNGRCLGRKKKRWVDLK